MLPSIPTTQPIRHPFQPLNLLSCQFRCGGYVSANAKTHYRSSSQFRCNLKPQ